MPLIPFCPIGSGANRNCRGLLSSTEDSKAYFSSSSFSLLQLLSSFPFFLLSYTGNCEPEGKPWSIQFQALHSSSQEGTKDGGECHIENAPAAPAAAPAPPVHRGVTRRSQILGWQGALLCFQFTVRLNLQRLTRLIYFVADRARRAYKKPWIHSPLKQNTMESEGSRRSWVLHSGPRHASGCVRIIRNQGTGHGPVALELVPYPLNYRLELIPKGSVMACLDLSLNSPLT